MREIKFRAWDSKEMRLSPGEIQHLGSWFDALAPGALYKGGATFMQYTGLKDKNGKEIYEGDAIKFYYWSTYEQRSFPEYVDFRETEMKEALGVVYWNESELSWYVKPIEGTTVYHGSETSVQLEEMPLVYAGLTMEAISEWLGEYDASEEDLKKYTICDGSEVVGNIYENIEFIEITN